MLVFIYPADSVIGGAIEEREICHISDTRVLYNNEDQYGYPGARKTCVFFTEGQAEKAREWDLMRENERLYEMFLEGCDDSIHSTTNPEE